MPTSSEQARWATVPRAAEYLCESTGEPVTESTVRRWAAEGRIRCRRIGARRMQIDLSSIDAMLEPMPPGSRRLSEAAERLARETAAALLPLTDEQREKLSLLLQPGRGWHGAA